MFCSFIMEVLHRCLRVYQRIAKNQFSTHEDENILEWISLRKSNLYAVVSYVVCIATQKCTRITVLYFLFHTRKSP